MIKLLCGENNIEYTGNGYLQCCRDAECPKKENNKILGFDCLGYIDNLPDGCKVNDPDENTKDGIEDGINGAKDDSMKTDVNVKDVDDKTEGHKEGQKTTERMIRTIEYVVA